MNKWKHLFSPGKIGSLYVKNRIVMAPLGSRLTTENGAVTEDMIEFYSQRARGGAGVIVIEAMAVDYPLGQASLIMCGSMMTVMCLATPS